MKSECYLRDISEHAARNVGWGSPPEFTTEFEMSALVVTFLRGQDSPLDWLLDAFIAEGFRDHGDRERTTEDRPETPDGQQFTADMLEGFSEDAARLFWRMVCRHYRPMIEADLRKAAETAQDAPDSTIDSNRYQGVL